MLQLHLSDQQFYFLLRCDLYYIIIICLADMKMPFVLMNNRSAGWLLMTQCLCDTIWQASGLLLSAICHNMLWGIALSHSRPARISYLLVSRALDWPLAPCVLVHLIKKKWSERQLVFILGILLVHLKYYLDTSWSSCLVLWYTVMTVFAPNDFMYDMAKLCIYILSYDTILNISRKTWSLELSITSTIQLCITGINT